ncbi:hydantoinase B/oxoprolinase family protein [Dyadobacter sandarakinus]|uniref:Hydantoinase B/oxoprolinase family protein n=1 Tax=Dyadobacter sandarakinus TaxID=2747268 RepID=A0ABX7I8B8_9BACT|nr:hydantoinase B/oxoprolinase family protein [Dyadobacter sandarakinus]QRR02357.1 hydantoinase B/oxoprolinase family protein [Dyadobacter sandarakinus]
MKTTETPHWKIFADTGGTFTDCLAVSPKGTLQRIKVLSSSCLRGKITGKAGPSQFHFQAGWTFPDELLAGFRFRLVGQDVYSTISSTDFRSRIFTLENDFPLTSEADFEISTGEEAPVLAARLLTLTPFPDPLPPLEMRLGTTRATNALLERKGAKTLLVVTKGFRDLLYIGTQQRPSLFQLNIPEPRLLHSGVLEIDERLDAGGNVITAWEKTSLPIDATYQSVAVSLLHAHRNNAHEVAVTTHLKAAGQHYISASAALSPFEHYLRRTQTTVVNAYLEPVLDSYLQNIKNALPEGSLKVMASTGSLAEAAGFRAKDSLLSGPAGGMVAAANAANRLGFRKAITFDMGGTSTDTALIDGQPELKYITEIDGIEFHNPTMAIETVAAGGGSVCWFDGFSLQVGPESAGASPGPACYGAGGPLTITDVNLLLGKLDAFRFGIPVHPAAAQDALSQLLDTVAAHTGRLPTEAEALAGLERIANEKMADAIRKISVEKGIAPHEFALITFGGAGGLHSCQLAELLGIATVIIPYDAGLFSAVGMGEAVVSFILSKQILKSWNEAGHEVTLHMQTLMQDGADLLREQGISDTELAFCHVYLRFSGQENTIEVPFENDQTLSRFRDLYTAQFGYFPENLIIELESIKVKMQAKTSQQPAFTLLKKGTPATCFRMVKQAFQQNTDQKTGLYDWDELQPGAELEGPAVLLNSTSTAYIPAGWKLVIQENRDAVLFRYTDQSAPAGVYTETVALQLFTNRFKAIAEEMGVQLQRTAFSVNVKERLDFSCALLDPDGELLVNAQHIPVHLGSMGICGRLVRDAISIGPGDVVITNHPRYGGSHLPDITLISGVFTNDGQCAGYLINRAHHAEVGGRTPGSMPPDATCLAEEGVVILPQYLVRSGEFQWDTLRQLFLNGPYPTRSFNANEADIAAALSALRKGSEQLLRLVKVHGLDEVRRYMKLLKNRTSQQLEQALQSFSGQEFSATEMLDDDHCTAVRITISPEKQVFDFTGTSPVHPNNLNANISIIHSAILYVLRLLTGKEIPLNDGLMRHVEIILPDNSFLHPNFSDDPLQCPAVVGGNTEVSQRLVDTLLKALKLAACSQGTMNNFLFGNESFGYYETIGGGTGAGPGFHGRSAVHQHMTNTRITDAEQLERKYPVRLLEFGVRQGSGGSGKWQGGDGIIRKIRFLAPLQVTLLGQHRKYAPYGLDGGSPGLTGAHTLTGTHGEQTRLPGICSIRVQEGETLTIETPGGGGFGAFV